MIYICIPAHNEQQTVGVVLWKLRQVLTEFPRDYQLLVTDDGSTDKTAEVLEPYTRVLPLTVVRTERRLGYAASLELLLREAVRRSEYPRRDVVIALQADFTDEPDDVVPLIKRLEAGADVAVGNKVSSTPEPRTRRWSRSLARFFARGQKWPEGVVTPFDGFRAYRLYAVKRAIEESAGRRLIRYDGWAGHAELLRSVLPHARRVDVVDVDDRPDRLQRPRREKPFNAAMQVRAMARNTEPAGLIGVEELDRIAMTTSRSRERAAVSAPTTNGRGARANGSRNGERRPESRPHSGRPDGTERRPGRPRSEKPAADRPATGGRSRQRPESGQPRAAAPARQRPPKERPPKERQPQDGRSAVETADPNSTPMEAVVADELITQAAAVTDAVTGDGTAAPAPKKKRRRRRRSGARGQAAGSEAAAPEQGHESESAAETEADVAELESGEGSAEPKRRRRGGRRGGRGRRKPRPEGTDAVVAESGSAGAPPAPDAAPGAPVRDAVHVESD